MKTFEEYLDKMGYSWNDFDRTNEMENLIEQYADEKAKQALSIADVSHRREQLNAFAQYLDEMHGGEDFAVNEIDNFLKSF